MRLREHDLASNPDCDDSVGGLICGEPFIEIPIEKTIVHEKYRSDDANHRHDIALIRLNKTVVFDGLIFGHKYLYWVYCRCFRFFATGLFTIRY